MLLYVQRGGLQAAPERGWIGPQGGAEHPHWMDHIVPEISLGWSSRMLGPSLGLGSRAGRRDVCHPGPAPSRSPPWEAPHHPTAARCPGSLPKPEQGSESCHPPRGQGSAPANNSGGYSFSCIPPRPFLELPEIWLRFFPEHRAAGLGLMRR